MSQNVSVGLRPSRVLALCLSVVAGTALACAWISLPGLALAPVAVGLAIAWAWHMRLALHLSPAAVRAVEMNDSGGVRWRDGAARWHEGGLLPGSYVSAWLIVLLLGAEGRRQALVLLPDSAAAEELRRLRVWLRWRLGPA